METAEDPESGEHGIPQTVPLHVTMDMNTSEVMGKHSDIRELNAVVLSMDFAGRDARGRHGFCRRGSACSRSSP